MTLESKTYVVHVVLVKVLLEALIALTVVILIYCSQSRKYTYLWHKFEGSLQFYGRNRPKNCKLPSDGRDRKYE